MKTQSKNPVPVKGLKYFFFGAFIILLIIVLLNWNDFKEGFKAGFNDEPTESVK